MDTVKRACKAPTPGVKHPSTERSKPMKTITYTKTVTTKHGKETRTYVILSEKDDRVTVKCLETGKTTENLKEKFLKGATEVVTETPDEKTPEAPATDVPAPKTKKPAAEPKPKYDKAAKAALVTKYAENRGLTVKAKGCDPSTLFVKRDKVGMTVCVNRTGATVYMRGALARQVKDLCDDVRPQDKGRTDYTVHVPDRYLDAFFATYYTSAATWKKEDDFK